jgi:PTH1 family peptidyl-tRNA hydrolase
MKLIVGLGNPGPQYAGTRHNVGFLTVDRLAAAPHVGPFVRKFEAELAEGIEGAEKVLYAKPQTFMNLSGHAVRLISDFFKVAVPDLLVVCDDVNLPLGQLRFRSGGSAGGHNGLKDIQRHLGTQDYARLRLGVGGPDQHQELVDHVLARFKPSEKAAVEEMIADAADAVLVWVKEGLAAAMNKHNPPKKGK